MRSIRAAGLACVLLALVALAPAAWADHAFSHRLYVTGRVVDVDGLPVPGQPVEVAFDGLQPGGPCFAPDASDQTGPRGDIRLCRHVHAMPQAPGNVTVTVAGARATAPVDRDLRAADVHLRLDEATPARDIREFRRFNETVRVAGHVYDVLRDPREEEGVAVPAVPRAGANVTVELRDAAGGVLQSAMGGTDGVGWYAVDVPYDGAAAADLVARTTQGDDAWEAPVEPAFRRAHVSIAVAQGDLFGAPGDRPGTRAPTPGLAPPLVLLALATLALIAGGGRPRAGR